MVPSSSDISVIYYSRTGHSAELARVLAEDLRATLHQISSPGFPGTLGFIRAALTSLTQRKLPRPRELGTFETARAVILCGPVWTSYPAAPLRALLRDAEDMPAAVGLFLTAGSTGSGQQAIKVAEKDFGRPFAVTGVLANSDEGSEAGRRAIADFLHALRDTPALQGILAGGS